ncbi:MAG: site-specific integrase [Verrucomicrobia bacterium]|nr:site-specific integrase [Verrucomicrobiota bacterium]
MASLFRRKGNPFWWLYHRKGKKWFQRSTKFRHDVSADTRKARELCARHNLDELSEAARFTDSRWEAWVPDFFAQRYATMPATKKRYETSWRTWLIFFDKRAVERPAQVNYSLIMGFLRWRSDPNTKGVYPCGRNTAIFEIKILGTILGEAVRRGFIVTNPARGLGLAKLRPREKPEITPEEEALIRLKLRDCPEWMQVGFEIAMATGCRLRETSIDMRNVDLERGCIHFVQKGGRIHSTALSPELLPLMRSLRDKGHRRTCELPALPSKEWWRFFRRIGLPHLCFHCTRVTVVTRLCRAGVPERVSMRFVGHSSTTVHRIYTRFAVDDLQPCVTALMKFASGTRKTNCEVVSSALHAALGGSGEQSEDNLCVAHESSGQDCKTGI